MNCVLSRNYLCIEVEHTVEVKFRNPLIVCNRLRDSTRNVPKRYVGSHAEDV